MYMYFPWSTDKCRSKAFFGHQIQQRHSLNSMLISQYCKSWFKVAISTGDSAGTVPHQLRRRGPDSVETREKLHRGLKKF